jgi:hypothetical protein
MILRHCGDETEHRSHVWELPGDESGHSFQCVGIDAAGAEIARASRFWHPRPELAPAPITWGATLCSRKRCAELAACSLDGEPFCLLHVDETIERACVDPDFARLLPGLDE